MRAPCWAGGASFLQRAEASKLSDPILERRITAPEEGRGVAPEAEVLCASDNRPVCQHTPTGGTQADVIRNPGALRDINNCTIAQSERICAASRCNPAPRRGTAECFAPFALVQLSRLDRSGKPQINGLTVPVEKGVLRPEANCAVASMGRAINFGAGGFGADDFGAGGGGLVRRLDCGRGSGIGRPMAASGGSR